MKRRSFFHVAAAGAAGAMTLGCARLGEGKPGLKTPAPPASMVLGTQDVPPQGDYRRFTRFGVNHLCAFPKTSSVQELKTIKRAVEEAGGTLDMIDAVGSRSFGIAGDEAARDKAIDEVIAQIRTAAEVGVPAIKYNMTVLDVVRTGKTPGRGGTSYAAWRWADAKNKDVPLKAGRFTEAMGWERAKHVIDRIMPVAEECKIRMACHPHDPGLPPEGYHEIQNFLGTVDGLKKFAALSESPYHGLNLCIGSVAEMLQDPEGEIGGVVRYFGERKRIFNVHFRNILGHRDDFLESYLDNGSMRMVNVIKALREVQYPYMVMPDHAPSHPSDPGDDIAYAFAFGYIRGLLQAVNDEPNGAA